jgi:hypothetical protein
MLGVQVPACANVHWPLSTGIAHLHWIASFGCSEYKQLVLVRWLFLSSSCQFDMRVLESI